MALVHKYFSPPRIHSPQKADLCVKAACIIQSLPPFLATVMPCAWATIKASDFYLYEQVAPFIGEVRHRHADNDDDPREKQIATADSTVA